MEKNKLNHLIEYLSPTMILSYFFLHKIFLVLIGIILSLYLINIKFFNSIMRSINKSIVIKKSSKECNKIVKSTKLDSINIKSSNLDSKITLVEKIEELGYIPSMDKDDKSNAA